MTVSNNPSFITLADSEMQTVDHVIAQQLQSNVPLVGNISHYIVQAGGKRLRPKILLLGALAYGHQHENKNTMAAVVEFIHTATLLHDDVVDESNLRRGNPTANAKFGNAASVLVGDFLYSRAFQMMVDVGNMRIMQIMANATNVIAEGEVMQLINMRDPNISEAQYLEVIESKTAKLFEASMQTAAILAVAGAEQERVCAQYGRALGVAFQIVDDILDYMGDASILGKNIGDDLREGKTTLPLINAMKLVDAADKALVAGAIETGDLSQLDGVLAIVQKSGALDLAKSTASEQVAVAVSACEQMPRNAYSEALRDIALQSLTRLS